MKHVEQFRSYKLTLDDQFNQPKSRGRKQSDRKGKRKPDLESAFERLEKKEKKSRKPFIFQDPNAPEKISHELFFVQWYLVWLTNTRETMGMSYFLGQKTFSCD